VSRADAAPGVARGSGPALSSVLVGCLVLHRARWPGRRKPSRRSLLPRLALRDLSSQTSRSLVEEETLDESSLGLLLDDEDEALVPWTETEEGLVPYFEKGLSQVSPRNRKPLWPGMEDTFVELAGMPIPNRLADALEERGFVEPSGIQFQAIPKLVRGEHVILDAPTGSGKTLAFLLPILARLQPTVNLGAQVLILVPTPELALQIVREVRWLLDVCCGRDGMCWYNPQVPADIACEVVLSRAALWDAVGQDTSICVSTAGLLLNEMSALKKSSRRRQEAMGLWMGSNLDTVVLDEVDVMFQDERLSRKSLAPRKLKAKQGSQTERLLERLFTSMRMQHRNRAVQLVGASASGSSTRVFIAMERILAKKYPKRKDAGRREPPLLVRDDGLVEEEMREEFLTGSRSLRLPETISHSFAVINQDGQDIDDRFGTLRLQATMDLVRKLDGLVVVTTPEHLTLDAVVSGLSGAGIPGVAKFRTEVGLSRGLDQESDPRLLNSSDQKRYVEDILASGRTLMQDIASGSIRVLVVKDSQVRGIDLLDVKYVLMMQLPASHVEYMHIAGRTGRMGRAGTAIVLCTPEEVLAPMARQMQDMLGITFGVWDAEAAVVQTLPEHLLPSAAAHDERASFDLQAQRRETGRRRLLNPASRYGLLNAQLSRTSADEAPPSSLREILGRDA